MRLIVVLLLAGAAAAAPRRLAEEAADSGDGAAKTSPLWGVAGEKWEADGPFIDFSYAGYRSSDAAIPRPPITKRLSDFRKGGRSDGSALQAMVEWANDQPSKAGWVVLSLPPGQIQLDRPLSIRRSQTVLRGAGRDATTLYITKSLSQVGGGDYWRRRLVGQPAGGRQGNDTHTVPSTATDGPGSALVPSAAQHGRRLHASRWTTRGGWISAPGERKSEELARVTSSEQRGSYTVKVDRTGGLKPGQLVSLMYRESGALAQEIMEGEGRVGSGSIGNDLYFLTPIKSIEGKTVTLRRALPLDIKGSMSVALVDNWFTLEDVGIEDLTIEFKWAKYSEHHQEKGYSGIELERVQDSWVRNVRVANVDNGFLVSNANRVTLQGIEVAVTKGRQGNGNGGPWDGHWGVRLGYSTDVLVQDFSIQAKMRHAVGADSGAMFCVYSNGRMKDGNLEMHRGHSAQILFTDIHLGASTRGFASSGPDDAGSSSGAYTTFWNIDSNSGIQPLPDHNGAAPGSCVYGPDINFIGVTFKQAGKLCDGWVYQPGRVTPQNLFEAQLTRRHGGTAAAAKAAATAAKQAAAEEAAAKAAAAAAAAAEAQAKAEAAQQAAAEAAAKAAEEQAAALAAAEQAAAEQAAAEAAKQGAAEGNSTAAAGSPSPAPSATEPLPDEAAESPDAGVPEDISAETPADTLAEVPPPAKPSKRPATTAGTADADMGAEAAPSPSPAPEANATAAGAAAGAPTDAQQPAAPRGFKRGNL